MCRKPKKESQSEASTANAPESPASPPGTSDDNNSNAKALTESNSTSSNNGVSNGTTVTTTTTTKGDKKKKEMTSRRHRGKRESYASYTQAVGITTTTTTTKSPFVRRKPKKQSRSKQKHGADGPSGGIEALLPSLIGVAILVCGVMAKMGFRGRAQVAGIDLGTTNSVICVQAPSKGVGIIDCMKDPLTQSPIIPSVVSFLEPTERPVGAKSKTPSLLVPHPSQVVVGQAAKKRIDSHPHHTLYNAKRILGRPPNDRAIQELQHEVEFAIHIQPEEEDNDTTNDNDNDTNTPQQPDERVVFRVPHHAHSHQPTEWMHISPQQVGSYVVSALLQLAHTQLGHENVNAAVICVPAKFDTLQRQRTVAAFAQGGVKVTRILEEPTAAALAYGLHQKQGVDYIVVYDFGGGTLDVSLLHVSEGFVDVMGSEGDDRLGGADFDAAIAHYWLSSSSANGTSENQNMVDNVNAVLRQLEQVLENTPQHFDLEQELSSHCPAILEHPLCTVSSFHTLGEQIKIQLSNSYNDDNMEDTEETPLEKHCLRLPPGMTSIPSHENPLYMVDTFCQALTKTTLTLTRSEFLTVSQPLFQRSILPVERLLQDLNIKTHEIDEVVMVGGTTRMPQIRDLVREALPESQLNTHIDPDITVAYGAASVID
ncbi:protein DnaK [Seminavis robusta]|uniref:Protein DnaK n=1 Tax=Seminavis robusta TaxID=568900 RepID=A0A9N8ESE8_9STRA|nr:protein DnaK [Seminavis robusta]|eukprot:Sro1810_g299120.1 protein DnaK (654) ;mRNA; f:5950-7911